MTSTEQEIVTMFDDCKMSAKDISTDTGLDIVAVKAVLAQYSVRYKQEAEMMYKAPQTPGAPSEANNSAALLNADERQEILLTMKQLAFESDNDVVRARMCMYLHEEVTGRNEARAKKSQLGNVNVNVLQINDRLLKAREIMAKVQTKQIEAPVEKDVINV